MEGDSHEYCIMTQRFIAEKVDINSILGITRKNDNGRKAAVVIMTIPFAERLTVR